MRVRLIAIALLAAGTVGLGGMAATTGANAQPGSTPDTYVNYWDTVGGDPLTRCLPAQVSDGCIPQMGNSCIPQMGDKNLAGVGLQRLGPYAFAAHQLLAHHFPPTEGSPEDSTQAPAK